MHATLDTALRAPAPGKMVRALSRVSSGARTTRGQIETFADHWRRAALDAVDSLGPKLVVVGDSLAQGIGASTPSNSYAQLVADEFSAEGARVEIVNLSRSGARIRDVLDDQLPALAALDIDPVAVLCTVGSNDLLRSVRLRAAGRAVETLLDSLPAGAVLATVPAAGSMLAKGLNCTIRIESARRDRRVADVGASLRSWRGILASDRFHPNDAGHAL